MPEPFESQSSLALLRPLQGGTEMCKALISRHVQRLSCRGQTSPLDRGLITFWRRAPSTAPSPVGARLPRVAALNEGMSSSAQSWGEVGTQIHCTPRCELPLQYTAEPTSFS